MSASTINATLAQVPASGYVPFRPSFTLCSSTRDSLPNYKIQYNDTIYLEIAGTPPFDLSITRTRDGRDSCGYPFDNRTSIEKPTNGTGLNKIVLRGTAYNYTPSRGDMYGGGDIEFKVGDSIQFFAVEHANNTGPGGGFRSFASTNYTLVANASDVGQWTPRLSGAEALNMGSIKCIALASLFLGAVAAVC